MIRKPDFSGFFGETFSLIGDGFIGIAVFVLVVGGVDSAGVVLALVEPEGMGEISRGFMVSSEDSLAQSLFQIVSGVVTLLASYFLLAHLLDIRGHLPSRQTRIWAYIGMSILAGLGIILGAILLIVPGIILAVRWSASSGFLIGKGLGVTDSLSASWQATKGKSWSIVGSAIVLFLAMIVAAAIMGAIAALAGSETVVGVVTAIAGAIVSAISLPYGIAIYLLVQSDRDEVGEVFA